MKLKKQIEELYKNKLLSITKEKKRNNKEKWRKKG